MATRKIEGKGGEAITITVPNGFDLMSDEDKAAALQNGWLDHYGEPHPASLEQPEPAQEAPVAAQQAPQAAPQPTAPPPPPMAAEPVAQELPPEDGGMGQQGEEQRTYEPIRRRDSIERYGYKVQGKDGEEQILWSGNPDATMEEIGKLYEKRNSRLGLGDWVVGLMENLGMFATAVPSESAAGILGVSTGLLTAGGKEAVGEQAADRGVLELGMLGEAGMGAPEAEEGPLAAPPEEEWPAYPPRSGEHFNAEAAAEMVENIRQEFTYQPRTEAARRQLQAIAHTVGPTLENLGGWWKSVADEWYEMTGSPEVGAAVYALPAGLIELAGLKTLRKGKAALVKRKVAFSPKGEFAYLYDAAGRLRPEVKKIINDSGLDLGDVGDVLPEQLTGDQMAGLRALAEDVKQTGGRQGDPADFADVATEAGEAATERKWWGGKSTSKAKELVETIDPDAAIMEAAEHFDMEPHMLPQYYSQNPTYRAIAQGLASIVGSEMDAVQIRSLEELMKRADNLIIDAGGLKDKPFVSLEFKQEVQTLIDDLEVEAEPLWKIVEEGIDPAAKVPRYHTLQRIRHRAKLRGGVKKLQGWEKRVYDELLSGDQPTFTLMDDLRKDIGEELGRLGGPSEHRGRLKKLYESLTNDLEAVARKQGIGQEYSLAKATAKKRFDAIEAADELLGKDRMKEIMPQMGAAVRQLGQPNPKIAPFMKLVKGIPEGIDEATKQKIIMSALHDAMVQGSRKGTQFNVAGFNDFMNNIKRNRTAWDLLAKEIGPEAAAELDKLHTLVGGYAKAMEKGIRTGLIQSVPGMMDEVKTISERVYGLTKNIPGSQYLPARVAQGGTPRSVAADRMMASKAFRDIVEKHASGWLKGKEAQAAKAERALKKSKPFKEWSKTLSKREAADMAKMGVLSYLVGEHPGPTDWEEKFTVVEPEE